MKTSLLLGLTGMLLAVAGGCASHPARFAPLPSAAPAAAAVTTTSLADPARTELLRQPPSSLFTLGPGDAIEIQVLGSADSRAVATVGLDGKIYYSLLPGLDVWGLTLEQTRALLQRELSKWVNAPAVAVNLRTVGSKYVWLLGRLSKPGIYPMASSMTLLDALATAGGTATASTLGTTEDLADLHHSFVMRQGQLLPVDFYRLLRQGDITQNIQLQADDFVYVPSALAQEVYVMGAVRSPRAVVYTEQMSLIAALAAANGVQKYDYLTAYYQGRTPDAYMSHVALVRGSLAEPQVAVVDCTAIIKGRAPDVLLEPGDIIYVPNSPFRTLKSYVNMIVNAFVTTVAANEGVRLGGGTTGNVGVSVPVGGR